MSWGNQSLGLLPYIRTSNSSALPVGMSLQHSCLNSNTPRIYSISFFSFSADHFSLSKFGRFAAFVLGSPHVSPAETKAHDEQYGIGSSFLEEQLFETRAQSEQGDPDNSVHEEDEENENEMHTQIPFPYATELLWEITTIKKKRHRKHTCLRKGRYRMRTHIWPFLVVAGGQRRIFKKTLSCITDVTWLEQQKKTTGAVRVKNNLVLWVFSLGKQTMCISKASTGDSLSTRMLSFTKDTTSSKQRICFGPFHHQVLCAEH